MSFSFSGWSGWPLGDHDDLHDYSVCIQLWLAVYERCIALGGKNDNPRITSQVVDGVTLCVGDDLPYLDNDGDHSTALPLPGDDAHAFWTGPRCYGHEASNGGGDYPGVPTGGCLEWDFQWWYDANHGEDYVCMRWEEGVWKTYRMLQEWLAGNCVSFVEWKPKSDGSTMGINGYDNWTATDPVTGLATSAPPPNYTVAKWAAKASIPMDEGGNLFTRSYPAEFRIKDAVTGTVIPCGDDDEDPITVTRPPDTTYRDGTAIQAGDYARWVGNCIEDDDYDTGQWCGTGEEGVSVWVPWPSLWVVGDGKVYLRNEDNTAWLPIEHPYGQKPRTISKIGKIERGDYLTPTVLNEIFRGVDILRWTEATASFVNYPDDAHNDGVGENNSHEVDEFQIYAPTALDPSYIYVWSNLYGDTNAQWAATSPVPLSGGYPTSYANALNDDIPEYNAQLDAQYFYGKATGIPHGPDGGHTLGCDVDYMNWATIGVNNGGGWGDVGITYGLWSLEEFGPDPTPDELALVGTPFNESDMVWDDNGQKVYFRKWRVWDTNSGMDPTRYSVKLGTTDKPNWCPPTNDGDLREYVEGATMEASYSTQGYRVENLVTIRRWDNYYAFAMPLSFWGG